MINHLLAKFKLLPHDPTKVQNENDPMEKLRRQQLHMNFLKYYAEKLRNPSTSYQKTPQTVIKPPKQ